MIKRLRNKFILTAMGALLLIVIVVVAAINLADMHQRRGQQQRIAQRIEQGGEFPGKGVRPWERRLRQQGEEPTDPAAGILPDGAAEEGDVLFPGGREEFLAFNSEMEAASSRRLLMITIAVGALSLVAMFVLVYLFSGRAVAPVVESLEKQKRFITDAGHELKTPLSVIAADVDVLEMDGVQNEWTESIRAQVHRMNDLVKNMLALSRMEEEFAEPEMTDVDFSALSTRCVESFGALAESTGRRFEVQIPEGIHVRADASAMEQLLSILIDNAIKYSTQGSQILVRLTKDAGKARAVLEVSNSVDVMPEGNLDRLFDRFYRTDTSRNAKTGGAGIGLSAARAIVTSHGGQIKAQPDGDHIIRFIAWMPAD